MAQADAAPHSPTDAPKRPKGILKNSSHQHTSPDARISPTATVASPFSNAVDDAEGRPAPQRELSEREIVQMNTERNAGDVRRRTSSNPRAGLSRRQSSQSNNGDSQEDGTQRLKWDEANLYLNEGQMGGRMKIDEPKTPYAGHYDPAEDEDDISALNAEELNVDELDMHKHKPQTNGSSSRTSDIPGLDLGEPEVDPDTRRESDGEKRVLVDSDFMDVDGGRHGEEDSSMSSADREKHKKFEELRKKHYEMKNVKNLLGHSEEIDALDEQ